MVKVKELSASEWADLSKKLAHDFSSWTEGEPVPVQKSYKIASSDQAESQARKAALAGGGMIKQAFDTRRIDQEEERNPRANLQHWNRSQQFLDEEDEHRLLSFSKLIEPLDEIKSKYGAHPEYHQSYARSLRDLVKKVVKLGKDDLEVFKPQLDYLEQLLFARYRLSLEEINKSGTSSLYQTILKKDESLVRRADWEKKFPSEESSFSIKDGRVNTQENIINAIFESSLKRNPGEKSVTRTITITIKDEVD